MTWRHDPWHQGWRRLTGNRSMAALPDRPGAHPYRGPRLEPRHNAVRLVQSKAEHTVMEFP